MFVCSRELIRQAFSAWEIVISIEFTETDAPTEAADIAFVFEDHDRNFVDAGGRRRTRIASAGVGVASASYPPAARISIRRGGGERWSTFQVQEAPERVDLFLVLIHEIGHALGLRHSTERTSVMYPVLERTPGEQLPVISNDDVERLRSLYGECVECAF